MSTSLGKVAVTAVALSLVAGSGLADGFAQSIIEPEVILEETANASAGGIIVPLLLLAIIAAVAAGGGGTTPVPVPPVPPIGPA